ncbi:MAG: adenylate/guanylate cyclase domain-containing protein [Alphaproteobacteria bacterium]|jgi:adenylate cyclase
MSETLEDTPPKRTRARLTTVLVGGVTLLILLAVGSVLWVTLTSATRNTFELLGERASATLDVLEAKVDGQLVSVTVGVEDFAKQFADGRLNITDRRSNVFHSFAGFLSAHPQVTAMLYVGVDQNSIVVTRSEGFPIEVPSTPGSQERRKFALESTAQSGKPLWAPPIWVSDVGQPVVTYIAPVKRGDELLGVVIAPVVLTRVSEFLLDLETEGNLSAFIVHNHDRVLAHPRMKEGDFVTTSSIAENPLPRIEDVPEPAFKLLAGGGEEATQIMTYAANVTDARLDDDTVIITRDTNKFGPSVWTLGVTLQRAIVGQEVQRLLNTAFVGMGILVFAVLLGFVFARHLNQQIGRLVTAAAALTRLDVATAPNVPDSRITELSEAARAFNRMIAALRLFEVYVPKQLVLRMMQGGKAVDATEERVLTIMFTDIRGFSTIAEHMDAGEIAGFLNEHFDMLAGPIEAEGGTVDKYIGDAIMAFWGAPERMPDHAARALRAAADIQRLVQADNKRRLDTGEPKLAIRIGIHTGAVVVGNIGSQNRINYTIVGDPVNIASRIDSLAKELATDEDCIVLVSGDACEHANIQADASFDLSPLGEREIRGREGTVKIFRLDAHETER